MMRRSRKILIGFISTLTLVAGASFLFPQVRLYVAAWAGSSEAMFKLADEYYTSGYDTGRTGRFGHNVSKGHYWLRKSLAKGNLTALALLVGSSGSVGVFDDKEKVYWLRHGCDLGIPWCAEELARAHHTGRFALGQDFGKSREYDDLAVELHRGKGTLKDHACQFLPPAPPWVYPWDQPPPLTPEVHPGIPRKSVPTK